MWVCVYIVCMYVYTCICMNVCVHLCVCMHVCVECMCMCGCVHVYLCVRVSMCIWFRVVANMDSLVRSELGNMRFRLVYTVDPEARRFGDLTYEMIRGSYRFVQ